MPSIAHFNHKKKPSSNGSSKENNNNKNNSNKTRRITSNSKQTIKSFGNNCQDKDNQQQDDDVTIANLLDNKPKTYETPLYHLKGRQIWKYAAGESIELMQQYAKPVDKMFAMRLEILNRRGVRKVRKQGGPVTHLASYFYECIGELNTGFRQCVICNDIGKDWHTDFYYMDFVEICQVRTVLCRLCMASLVDLHVSCDTSDVSTELNGLRQHQPYGVYVNSFLISCGF